MDQTGEDFLAGLGTSLDITGDYSGQPHLDDMGTARKRKKAFNKNKQVNTFHVR